VGAATREEQALKLRYRMAAVEDADEAAKYLDQREPGLGSKFLEDLAAALHKIESQPAHYPRYELCEFDAHRDVRHVLLSKFSYLVV
jgi:hypothetical protein